MKDDYILDILGALQQSKSKKQINADIRQLEKMINMLRITGTFANGSTKKELNAYIKSLQSQLNHVKLTAKIDNRNLKRQLDSALNGIKFKDIDVLNIDGNKAKLKIRKTIADIKAYAEKSTISINVESKKNKLSNDLISYLNKNTKINESSVLLKEAEKVRELIDAVGDRKTLREATDAFQLYKSQVSATGFATQSATDKIKTMLGHVTKIGSVFGIASMAMNNFVKSLQTLKSNDSILTEISKTSEMTKQQLKELGDEAFKVASKYGQLSSNYLLAVQEMARSGYENTSKELGELSLLAQSAGDMTADSANNYLLATDAAYKYSGSVEKLNAALDGANYISNRNSASLTDIADATRVSASFAANAGVAIDELTAAEATMIATTKRSGSEIGRAFRSIILNLQQVSGEFDGEVIDEEQLKKVEARCHSLGVELEYMKDGVPTLRNTMEVLKELAEVYNSLPDNSAEKQGLIADLGGKYHANALSSLLSRWDLYEKMLSEFSQGTGSALEEANKTADSWEGRLNSLQNTFDSFVNTLTNKDAIMGGVSFFDRLLQGAEALTDTIGEIPVVLTTLNTAMVAMNKNYGITSIRNEETGKLDIQGNLLGIDFTAIKQQKKHFEEAEEAIAGWNRKLSQGQTDINKFSKAIVQNNAQFKDYLSTCSKDAPASLKGYKAYLNAAGVSTDALRLKTIALNTALSLGLGIVAQVAMKGFQLISTAVDDYLHKLDRQQEKLDDALSAYEGVKSELESVNSELDENKKKIEELEAKDKLTYAEKGQLEELRRITEQLELQKEISEWQLENKQKDAAMESVAYVNTKYNLGDSNIKDVDGLIPNILSGDHRSLDIAEDVQVTDAEYLAATYRAVSGELENLIDKRKELSNDSQDAIFVDNDIETYKASVEDVKTEINDMLSSLMEQKANMQDYFDTIKDTPYEDMSTDARKCYDAMQQINTSIQTLYYGLGNNRLNSEVINEIFNIEDIELTKEKLIEMAQAGTLNPAVIASHEKLADAILNSNLVADEGCGLFETLCNEIYALVSAEEKAVSMSERLSITQTVDQINTQLKPAFDSLKSAYQDIFSLDEDTGKKLFSLDDVDITTFEAVRAELEKLDEIDGITVDYSSFERFVSVLSNTSSTAEEVQAQFDALATSIIYATDCTNMSAETYDLLVKSLTEMGVTNADEVLSNLRDIQEELVDLGYNVANITANEAAELINLGSVSAETAEYLRLYLIQKELAQNPLNTIADITALEDLCNALGVTGELYESVIALKDAFDAKERGAVSAGLDESIEYYQGKIAELANGQADFKFSFSTPDISKTSGSKSSSSKDTIDTFDWIQQAIENVEKEIEELDEVVNSAYSTFSQKNEALAQEISKVSEEIDLQQQAYDEYMRKADSIGLPEHYKELVQSGTIGIEDIADENLRGMIDEYQKWYDKAIDAQNAIKDLKTDMKDLYVNAYELQTDNLKDRLDSDSITEKQYLEGLKTAYEKFYAELEDFAQQYHEAVLDYLDKEKDYLNNVAGAASSLLDTEIDNIRDDADAQESSLKRQIDLLEAKKKPLQDELDALEDKARKENLIYNLQKAQYALARAEYQRPKLVNHMPDTIVI